MQPLWEMEPFLPVQGGFCLFEGEERGRKYFY